MVKLNKLSRLAEPAQTHVDFSGEVHASAGRNLGVAHDDLAGMVAGELDKSLVRLQEKRFLSPSMTEGMYSQRAWSAASRHTRPS